MDEIIIFFKIGLLIFSAISLISYWSTRSDAKQALRSMDDDLIVRQLTPEEKAVLINGLQGTKLNLLSDDVYQLTGEYSAHGLSGDGGNDNLHDMIGGVEVLLPFDLQHYVQPFNEALVVRAEKQAIVIMLNGEGLLASEQRELLREQQQNEWTSGKIGTITPLEQEPVDEAMNDQESGVLVEERALSSQSEITAMIDELPVDILGQRDETQEEMQARVGRGINFVSSILWVGAVVLFMIAFSLAMSETVILNIIIAVVISVLGFFFFFKKKNYSDNELCKVNRARGQLIQAYAVSSTDSETITSTFFLGDKIPLVVPEQLNERLNMKVGDIVEIEARVTDNSLVSFNKEWSLTEEVNRFKIWYWGRYFLAALVGVFALIVYAFNNDTPYSDFRVVAGYYFSPVQTYTDSQSVLSSPPKQFSQIYIQGSARCEYSEGGAEELGLPVNDCAAIRWDGEPSEITAELTLDKSIRSLLDGSFITIYEKVERIPNYNAMLNRDYSSYYGYSYGSNSLYRDVRYYYVNHFNESLQIIEQACDAGLPSCEQLKSAILNVVSKRIAMEPITEWATLMTLSRPGESLQGFADDSLFVMDLLRETAKEIVYPDVAQQIRAFAVQVLNYQTEGVVIHTDNFGQTYGERSQPLLPRDTKMRSWQSEGINSYVDMLNAEITNSQTYPFELSGIVTGIRYELSGAPILVLNTKNYGKIASDALARILLLTLGIILGIGGGIMCTVMLLKASKRKELIKAYCNGASEQPTVIVS